eukprot:1159145-Pelagomonas_calceolata.AAC.37
MANVTPHHFSAFLDIECPSPRMPKTSPKNGSSLVKESTKQKEKRSKACVPLKQSTKEGSSCTTIV